MSRYAEYKDSCTTWMGQVPSHWKLERAKWHFTSRNERGNDTPVLLAATQKYGMYPQDMVEGVVKVAEGTDVQQFRTVHKGDFVISLRSFQGGFERSDYEGVCSPAYQVFYADDSWNNDYLKYLFKNELFIDAMNALTVGIREGRNIKYEDFANSVLAIPPLAEQADIAEYLDGETDRIDAIIAEAKASIEEYKTWKASIIHEAVTKGLDPNAEMKDSGITWIGNVPIQWSIGQLGKFVTVYNGDRSTNYPTPEEILPEGIPFFTSYDLDYDEVVMHQDGKYLSQHKYESLAGYKTQIGDIVFCLRGSIGKCAINLQYSEGTVASSLMGIRCNSINNKYAFYLLTSSVVGVQNDLLMNGTCAANLSAKNVCTYKIPVPPLDEQKAIADHLDCQCGKINHLVQQKEMLIADLESYKKSLIFEVVTGKRKVV